MLNFATKTCHNKTNKKHGKKWVIRIIKVSYSAQMWIDPIDKCFLLNTILLIWNIKKSLKQHLIQIFMSTLEKTLKKTIFLTRTLQLSNLYTQFSMKRSLIKFTRRMDQSFTLIWLIPFWRYFFTRCRWWINTRSRTGYRSSWI